MKTKKDFTLITILIIGALLLVSPYIVKSFFGSTSFVGDQTYYHLRMANQYKESGLESEDLLQDRSYSINVFHILIAKIGLSDEATVKFIPPILGIISLTLLYFILKKINIGKDETLFGLLIALISPIFLFTFTSLNPAILVIPLMLGGILLFLDRNYWSLLVLSPIIFISFIMGIAGLVVLLIFMLNNKKTEKLFFYNLVVFILLVVISLFVLKTNPLIGLEPFKTSIDNFFVEFGATQGYSIIILALSVIGIRAIWKRGSPIVWSVLIMLIAVVGSLFYVEIRILLYLIIAILAGISISSLSKRKWNVPFIKDFTLILILCSIIFSSVVFLKNQINDLPEDKIEAANYLKATEETDVILSSVNNGFLIEYYSGRKTFIDGNSFMYKDYENKSEIARGIFYARALDELEVLLEENGINHIFVDRDMRQGGIWNSRGEGLLFFLENSNKFARLFGNEEAEVYRYVGKELKE